MNKHLVASSVAVYTDFASFLVGNSKYKVPGDEAALQIKFSNRLIFSQFSILSSFPPNSVCYTDIFYRLSQ